MNRGNIWLRIFNIDRKDPKCLLPNTLFVHQKEKEYDTFRMQPALYASLCFMTFHMHMSQNASLIHKSMPLLPHTIHHPLPSPPYQTEPAAS